MDRNSILCGNFGYHLYSFGYFLASMQRLGQKSIELWGAAPHLYQEDCTSATLEEMRRGLTAHGLAVACYTPEQCAYPINIAAADATRRRKSIAYMKQALEIANRFEAPRVVMTPGQGLRDENREEAWKRCADALAELGDYAQKQGVAIVLEHLTAETTNLCVYARELAAMLDEVNSPVVRGMVDVDMAARVGESPADYAAALGERLAYVHFADGMPGGHLAPGDGILPLGRYLDELKTAGYKGYLSLEILHDRYLHAPEKAYQTAIGWLMARL